VADGGAARARRAVRGDALPGVGDRVPAPAVAEVGVAQHVSAAPDHDHAARPDGGGQNARGRSVGVDRYRGPGIGGRVVAGARVERRALGLTAPDEDLGSGPGSGGSAARDETRGDGRGRYPLGRALTGDAGPARAAGVAAAAAVGGIEAGIEARDAAQDQWRRAGRQHAAVSAADSAADAVGVAAALEAPLLCAAKPAGGARGREHAGSSAVAAVCGAEVAVAAVIGGAALPAAGPAVVGRAGRA